MPSAEALADAKEIIVDCTVDGSLQLRRLRDAIAEALETAVCRRCGAMLAEANALDAEESVDRLRWAIAGTQVFPGEFQIFEVMYREARPLCLEDFLEAGVLRESKHKGRRPTSGTDRTHSLRVQISSLRRKLRGSNWDIRTLHGNRGAEPTRYELWKVRERAEAAE